ncbi:uncharacterized protein LOC116294015 [Actinia tenebrosa]|uniref:Uncharacterized protein LOC116294015 n=1 Tax=Actinia tenebrosa TaxID=6105 RepID=A0A6P8HQL3_ACTTE|nr:uncharacterized protein LOC116294015 [Actinia tenebrosa]
MMDIDYQSYLSIYRVHWQRITDFSGVHSVYVGLKSGHNATTCDVSPLEKAQDEANYHVFSGLNLKSGSIYYACLKVVDNAQNAAYFTSDGIVIDNTSPSPGYVIDGNTVNDIDFQKENSVLWATWSNFTEEETEIVQYKLAFGTSPGKEDIQEFTEVGLVQRAPSTRLNTTELATAKRYYASVIAINKLGLPSEKVSSDGVLIDITPPSFIFSTTDGTDLGQDVRYSRVQSLSCSWRCDDEESKLKLVEVSFGLQPGSSDVKQFTTVNASSMQYEYQASLKSGIIYFATIRCTNNAGLQKTSTSNGVIYDDTPPQGLADDGDYQNSTNKLKVDWKFVDAESGILMYHIIILKSDGLLQEGPFEFPGNISSETLFLESTLDAGKTYFTNITGYNGAGLASSVITDGFTIDNTPPTCNSVWHGDKDFLSRLRFVSDAIILYVSWNCSDQTKLKKLQFAVKEKHSSKFILPFHSLNKNNNYKGTATITARRTRPKFEAGKTYVIGLELTNSVELSSVFWTEGVKVDTTPPIFTHLKLKFNPRNNSLTAFWDVKDEESGLDVVKWGLGSSSDKTNVKNLTIINISSKSLNIMQDLELGSTYFFSVEAINIVGLLNRAVSNGVVTDCTAPNSGLVYAQYILPLNYDRNNNVVHGSSFAVSWTGFIDKESGISQYSWAAGNNLQSLLNLDDSKYTNIQLDESVGGVQIKNVTLVGNTTYYVCIRATNGAGLQRTDCSPGMKVVLGKFSAGLVNDGPRNSNKDLDFQLDDRALWAHWDGFDDPINGVSSYEWCIGDHPHNSSVKDICRWPYTQVISGRTEAHRFFNLTLFQGKTYYANVKAINSQGENVYATSDGVVVDRSHPEGEFIRITPALGKDTLYTTSFQAPSVIWDMNDKESGMNHFRIGAGTFPHQDDLLSFKKIDGPTRSVNMRDLNFTVSKGLNFFVIISGYNMLGLETTLTSQQVVVDWTPPLAGIVIDGEISGDGDPETKDRDYQTSRQSISAHWYGFEDNESDIVHYKWCLGSKQGTCSLTKMVSAGLLNYVSVSLDLREGFRYFVMVEATNGAGLTQMSSSDGVTIDSSPPATSKLSFTAASDDIHLTIIGNRTYQSSGRSLKAQWRKITDIQSGITSLKYCVGKLFNVCNVIEWTHLALEDTSITHIFDEPFSSGTTLYVSLEAINGAGLSLRTHSKALVIDSSPPSIGRVSVGNTNGMKYFKRGEVIEGVAIGFEDKESGIAAFEWAICFAISTRQCTDSFISTGLNYKFTKKDHDLTPGVSYRLMVRVHNQVSLQSEAWSNTFTLDNDYPIPKSVFDGIETTKDISIQSSTNALSANWEPFINFNSRITDYELCVGSKPSVCNIVPYRNVGLFLKGEISEITLKHMSTYYITVRAWNEAGNTANTSTDGVKIDSTPPKGGEIRDGNGEEDIDYQADDSFISANWDQFTDAESGIEKYIWCVGTAKGSCDVINEKLVLEARYVGHQLDVPVNPGLILYVKVTAVNGGGGKTTLYSDGVVIDSTPPEITEVKDLRSRHHLKETDFITSKAKYCVAWKVIDKESDIQKSEISVCPALTPNSDCLISSVDVGVRLAICMSNLEFHEGVKYIAIAQVTNNAGLSSTKTSDGFVLDFSPPDTGEVYHVNNLDTTDTNVSRFTSSDIKVRWHGFWDKESSVSKYFVCLEEGLSGICDHITNFTDVGNLTDYSFKGIDLKHNTRYYVFVIAENGAGLQSNAVSSVGVLMDATAPLLGHVLHDGDVEGKERHFQNSTLDVKAHWTTCEDPESDIIKVAWCAGTTKGRCEISKMRDISPSVHNVHSALEKPVRNGQVLYVTVQATNGAGETTTVTSDGITIDGTPPMKGKVLFDNTTNEVNYLFGENDIDLHWLEFTDNESGIQSYEVAICDARNLTNCPQPYTSVNNATRVQITGLDFESGAMYVAIVRATNFAGLKIDATSKGITVDYSPPFGSHTWIGPESKHIFFQSSKTELKVRWQMFNDAESGIFSYEICLTSSDCNVSDYLNVGLNTSYDLTKLELEHGKSYYVTVKGTNGAGLTSTTITDTITIDTTPPEPFIDSSLGNKTTEQKILRFNCTEEFVGFEWNMFDDPESGISRYELCVGTEEGLCNIVPHTSLTPNLSSRAFTHKRVSSSQLFAKFKAFNNVGLYSMQSKECVLINRVPRIQYVKDLNSSNINDDTEIDWTANTTSLRMKWDISDNVAEHKSKMRVEVAVTLPFSNLSYPRINSKKSWNGEPFALNFTNLELWKNNLSIESLDLKPLKEYRSVVRIWNEGEIYSEASSDGVRFEPNRPLPRKIVIQDISSEKERLRWLPNLRLPGFNRSDLIPEILYISSPSNIFAVVSSIINITNQTETAKAELLSDSSQDFKVLFYRVRSGNNSTNTSENILETETLPGIASPQGPCCANYTSNDVTMLTDIHYKPTLPTQMFGSFVALLKQRYLAVASIDKVFIFSLQNKSLNSEVITITETISGISHSEDCILITSTRKLHVYNLRINEKNNSSLHVEKMLILSWRNFDGGIAVLHNTTIAATGRTAQNKGVVGIFHVTNGVWQVNKILGETENSTEFAKALAINNHFLVVLSSSYLIVYSLDDFEVAFRINLKILGMNLAEPSFKLTKSDVLILVSKKHSKIVILNLEIRTKLYREICSYKIPLDIKLSDKFDSMDRDGGTVIALGMQTLGGVDGVLLIGFQGAFAYHLKYDLGQCLGLGRILSRDNKLRVDDGVPRASVSIQGSTIVFGTPGELTWPDRNEDAGTGRVYIITYCSLNHKRVKISTLVEQQPLKCETCEDGRRSLGGVTTICTVCENRKCALPFVDDPLHFVTKVCNDSMCPTNEKVSNKTNGIKIIQMNGTFFEEGAVNEYTIKLVETTRAGMSTTSESEPFIIDTTSPVVGTVYDGLGSDQNTNCSSNETLGEDSQCSTRSFQNTDIDYTNNTSELHARWVDFADNESDITEHFWCVGTKPMLDDIRQCESTGHRQNGSHYGLDFKQGDTYYVTVVACNGAQRCSAGHSNGVTIDTTPPSMQYVRDGVLGPDMDYQVFLDIIFAYFKASDENSDISSYEVAWGTAPGLTDIKEYEEIVNTTIWYAKFKNNTLEKKKKYFATVRASNKAGILSEPMSSDGIIVGKSEYTFDKNASASFFFDTVNVKTDGTREDDGVGQTYGTLEVPKGAVDGEVKLQCYTLGDETVASNKSEDGPLSNPSTTKPKQFMLGNYSFQIKAMEPLNNTIKEGYKFAKPIKISMFYDVDNLVRANKRVVNKEVNKEDINPVLYLWDIKNNTWIDASLSCPEPWQYINRTIKLLTVHICHLTQFAFFWSFKAKNGLIMFEKNTSVYDANGDVVVLLETRAQEIDLPIKRSKGSNGNIEVYWSLQSNESLDSNLIWPKSGNISMTESQWNANLSLRVASNEKRTGKQVIYVRLDNVTGGAILASRDKIESSLIIVGSSEVHQDPTSTLTWIIGVVLGVIFITIAILIKTKRKKGKYIKNKSLSDTSSRQSQLERPGDVSTPAPVGGQLHITNDTESGTEIIGVSVNLGEYNGSTFVGVVDNNEIELNAMSANVGKRSFSNEDKQHSKEKEVAPDHDHRGEHNNPSFENDDDVEVEEMKTRLGDPNTVANEGINKVLKNRHPQNGANLPKSSEAASSAGSPAIKDIVSLTFDGALGASKEETKKTKAENRGYDNQIYQMENDDDACQLEI